MASDPSEGPEKLFFDTKGDVLLILTRRSVDKVEDNDVASVSKSLKRKSPNDAHKTITMLVSSKHMTLASRVFDAMLSDARFKEGAELITRGKVEIELPDDDPVAFSIMAQVIHGRNRSVTRNVTFTMLLNLAILVDKYQMHDALGYISEHWIKNLSKRTLVGPANDENFGTTQNDCYLPSSIIDAIKTKRIKALERAFAALNRFSKRGLESESYCKDQGDIYDHITTGSFMRNASLNGLWPIPAAPYASLRLKGVLEDILEMNVRHWCGTRLKFRCLQRDRDIVAMNACINREMFKEMNEEQIKPIKENISGLNITHFQHKPKPRGISPSNLASQSILLSE